MIIHRAMQEKMLTNCSAMVRISTMLTYFKFGYGENFNNKKPSRLEGPKVDSPVTVCEWLYKPDCRVWQECTQDFLSQFIRFPVQY